MSWYGSTHQFKSLQRQNAAGLSLLGLGYLEYVPEVGV